MDADGLIDGRGTQCTSRFLRSTPTKEETEMKMPRFFIILGACALLLAVRLPFQPTGAVAGPLPIVRVDPRAGDPDEPAGGYALPYDVDDLAGTTDQALSSSIKGHRNLGWRRLMFLLASPFAGRR
jgi:hypothetical protein